MVKLQSKAGTAFKKDKLQADVCGTDRGRLVNKDQMLQLTSRIMKTRKEHTESRLRKTRGDWIEAQLLAPWTEESFLT